MLSTSSFFLDSHKYDCSLLEQFLMVLITAITNLSGVPALIVVFKRKNYFPAFMGFFVIITSFIYHFMESIALRTIFKMDEYQWHKLDNIASITCFILLFVYLMDNRNPELDTILSYSGLIITITLQESDPWNIWFTVLPIVFFGSLIPILSYKRNRYPHYQNRTMLKNGLIALFLAFFCFYKALDEYQDYLRFFHGCWHMMVGITSFYLWQARTRVGEEFCLENLLRKKLDMLHFDVKYI